MSNFKALLEKPDAPSSVPVENGKGAAANSLPELIGDHLIDGDMDDTDDTPTVLSKNAPATASPETPIYHAKDLRGHRLAHFELIAPIGVGGMAAVLMARDAQLDRIVALKVLPPDMAGEPENVQRFHQEARAAAKLDHENIARVFYCGEDQGLYFIAFEFVEGENLRAKMEKNGPIYVDQSVQFLIQVATGLAHAAQRGVVHRDIKPSNIIITPSGRAKLVDMGLARTIELQGRQELTQSGVTLGTFEYISPEQALEPREADVRSDIYSLGCTFYHVMTGHSPVPEGTAAKKLHHHQHIAPDDPRQLNPDIPDSVAAILSTMMAKAPKDRYQSAEQLIQDLLQVAAPLGITDVPAETVTYGNKPLPAPPQKRLGLLIGLSLICLVGVVFALSFAPDRTGNYPTTSLSPGSPVDGQKVLSNDSPRKNDKPAHNPISGNEDCIDVKDASGLPDAVENHPKTKCFYILNGGEIPREIVVDGTSPQNILYRNVEFASKDPKKTVKITLKIPEEKLGRSSAILRINGANVKATNIHFHIETKPKRTPQAHVAGVLVEDGKFDGVNCIFSQDAPFEDFLGNEDGEVTPGIDVKSPIASVALRDSDPKDVSQPSATLNRCWFWSGQTAVEIDGKAVVNHTNCAFGPHCTLFHVHGKSKREDTKINLDSCSSLIVYGPAFRIDDSAFCQLNVTHSIFSGQHADKKLRQIHLIHQRDASKYLADYQGERNCYHNLNAFWVRKDQPVSVLTWGDFKKMLDRWNGKYLNSNYLPEVNPWRDAKPLITLGKNPDYPQLAFHINEALSELRQITNSNDNPPAIGVSQFAGRKVYDSKLKPLSPPVQVVKDNDPDKGKIIVDGKGEEAGRYVTLKAAISDAKKVDTIWIKADGRISVHSIQLSPNKKVTIKPYPKSRPILTLAKENRELDAALFKLTGGDITFEDLAFELHPETNERDSQSIVALLGGGRCAFMRCHITLRPSDNPAIEAELRLVSLPALGAKMMAKPGNQLILPPMIELSNCFVRGKGVCVTQKLPAAIRQINVSNSLIALDGTFFFAGGALEKMPDESNTTKIRLSRSTMCLTENLVHLDQQKQKHSIPLDIEPSDCLFIAPNQYSLLALEGVTSEVQARYLVKWNGNHNAYCGYGKILDAQLPTMTPFSITKEQWMMNESMNAEKGKSRFLTEIPSLAPPFSDAETGDFSAQIKKMKDNRTEKEDAVTQFGAWIPKLQDQLPAVPQLRAVPTMKPDLRTAIDE